MNTLFILIVMFVAPHAPQRLVMQEFRDLQTCQNAGMLISETLHNVGIVYTCKENGGDKAPFAQR